VSHFSCAANAQAERPRASECERAVCSTAKFDASAARGVAAHR
jgi:hypothetical protein